MPTFDTSPFYDGLAELYDLIYEDWERSLRNQAAALTTIIQARWSGASRILDAACGIGTQSLGLAANGFDVTASDLSPASVARAEREASRRGLSIAFSVADLRSLSTVHRPAFDVVLACDNAIPHLQTEAEILAAFREMRSLLRVGGGCLISVRDYTDIDRSQSRMIPYGIRNSPKGRYVVFQVWDFVDPDHYELSQFFVRDAPGEPQVSVFRVRYHAIPLLRLMNLLKEAGFTQVEVLTGQFFQPVLVGTNPEAS